MDIKQHYFCLYSPGLAGTWLAWFINQHKDFPQYKYDKLSTHGVTTDLACNGATWCFTKDTEDAASDTPMTFDEYIENWQKPESSNACASKNCIKVLPDHDLSWDRWRGDESVVLNEVLSHTAGCIYPYVKHNAKLLPFFANRVLFMWSDQYTERADGKTIDSEVIMDMLAESSDNIRKPESHIKSITRYTGLHAVDIDALLRCEQYEYDNLLAYINQPPIDGWEHLVNDYRQQFICRDWEKMLEDRKKSDENT